jgi:hypothetical protein
MKPFEHGHVWIVTLLVPGDAVVGEAGENLVEAGIGEFFPVGQDGDTLLVRVAVELALLRDGAPEKRQQRPPAFLRRRAPEGRIEPVGVGDAAMLLVHQQRIGAVENFLPAESVNRNEEYIFCFVRRRVGGQRKQS